MSNVTEDLREELAVAQRVIDSQQGLLTKMAQDLLSAEEALATYQAVGDGKFYYYVSFAHHGGFGGTQVEMDAPISSGMDVLDLMEMIKEGPNEPGEVVILGWQELDRL